MNFKRLALSIACLSMSCGLASCQTTQPLDPQTHASPLTADARFGTFDRPATANTNAVLIPQWHLSPQTDTRGNAKSQPQDVNQFAIFDQLSDWVDKKQISTVVVEGCEGEITDSSPLKFNGWSLQDLEKLPIEKLEQVDTQIGLKLKAKYREKLTVSCGDDLQFIKRNQLTLSDLRGLLGFKLRISAATKPDARESYISAARDVLKLPADASETQVVSKIDSEIQEKLDKFEREIHLRNEAFARAVKRASGDQPVPVVIGAIHIEDLKGQIPATLVFTPKGLQGDEGEVLREARKLLR